MGFVWGFLNRKEPPTPKIRADVVNKRTVVADGTLVRILTIKIDSIYIDTVVNATVYHNTKKYFMY